LRGRLRSRSLSRLVGDALQPAIEILNMSESFGELVVEAIAGNAIVNVGA
jgi:hypothetical protein